MRQITIKGITGLNKPKIIRALAIATQKAPYTVEKWLETGGELIIAETAPTDERILEKWRDRMGQDRHTASPCMDVAKEHVWTRGRITIPKRQKRAAGLMLTRLYQCWVELYGCRYQNGTLIVVKAAGERGGIMVDLIIRILSPDRMADDIRIADENPHAFPIREKIFGHAVHETISYRWAVNDAMLPGAERMRDIECSLVVDHRDHSVTAGGAAPPTESTTVIGVKICKGVGRPFSFVTTNKSISWAEAADHSIEKRCGGVNAPGAGQQERC